MLLGRVFSKVLRYLIHSLYIYISTKRANSSIIKGNFFITVACVIVKSNTSDK